MTAPPAASRGFIAHGRSPGLQRIAVAAFPNLMKGTVARSAGTPLTVAGAATDQRKPTVFPFHPRSNRGTVLRLCPSFEKGCQMQRDAPAPRCGAGNPRRPRLGACVGACSKHRKRLARTSAGNSANDLGGEPRSPNDILSSHKAVILVSAKMGHRIAVELSASAEGVSAPNSASANRRSISCCNRASASRAASHVGALGEEPQNWPLTCMRFEARTTAGAQIAREATPRRNWRRGTRREPILCDPQPMLMNT